mmetsp:Transcript_22154/g.87889  ORF Transcript_22154/g.87889 Transcript_22154/m.87889 type:complete len:405 (-) Transcript_22154:220-1434(-)
MMGLRRPRAGVVVVVAWSVVIAKFGAALLSPQTLRRRHAVAPPVYRTSSSSSFGGGAIPPAAKTDPPVVAARAAVAGDVETPPPDSFASSSSSNKKKKKQTGAAAATTSPPEETPARQQQHHQQEQEESQQRRRLLRFPELESAAFRHPLDKDLTEAVAQSPVALLRGPARTVGAATIEQALRLDNLAFALRVSETQLPELHALCEEACAILGVPEASRPELFVRSDPRPNAYTLAVDGAAPFVVVTSSLVDLLTPDELRAVIGHELGHLRCEHSLWILLAQIAASGVARLPVLGPGVDRVVRRWRRAAEYSCDRAALVVAQDEQVVINALLKLVSGVKAPNADAFLQQARDYDAALKSSTPLIRAAFQTQLATMTHPLPLDRAVQLDKWAKSREYKAILKTGV